MSTILLDANHQSKIDITRQFKRYLKIIETETNKKFELEPKISLASNQIEPRNILRDDESGKLIKAEIILPNGLGKHPELLYVIAMHEIRENLLLQHYASLEDAHEYAVSKESDDIDKVGLSKKWYQSIQDRYIRSADPNFFDNLK